MVYAEASPSKKVFDRTLFLFRRDLRLEDNTGLSAAVEQSYEVILALSLIPASGSRK